MSDPTMPVVTIVIPAYNHADYLGETIESALAQSYRDFEVFVVDDGSSDATPYVLKGFGDAVRWIRQENSGMAASRNTGIREARGEFIGFLDDDDLWEPNYLARVIPVLQKNSNTGACFAAFRMIDAAGNPLPQKSRLAVPPEKMYDTLIDGGFFPPCSVTVRKVCFNHLGVFDTNLQGYADWDMWLRISHEYDFVGLPQVLVKYRIHSQGLSSNVQHMFLDNLKAVVKHFGPQDEPLSIWPYDRKRAYGAAYFSAALGYYQHGQLTEVIPLLKTAFSIFPELLTRTSTFFELACGNQPRGYRGQASLLDLERSSADMLHFLDAFFKSAEPSVQPLRNVAFGNAYLALAMLSDQSGLWSQARIYLLKAIQYNPKLISTSYLRRLAKLSAGKRIVGLLKRGHYPNTFSQSSSSLAEKG